MVLVCRSISYDFNSLFHRNNEGRISVCNRQRRNFYRHMGKVPRGKNWSHETSICGSSELWRCTQRRHKTHFRTGEILMNFESIQSWLQILNLEGNDSHKTDIKNQENKSKKLKQNFYMRQSRLKKLKVGLDFFYTSCSKGIDCRFCNFIIP